MLELRNPHSIKAALEMRPNAVKLVRIHAEYGVRRIKWSASRSQRPPNIPKVEDTQGDRYLGGSVTTELPRYDPIKGGYDFLVSGEYIYLQAVVRETGEARQETNRKPGVDALPTGKYPYFLALQGYQAREAISSVTAGGITDNNWMTKIGGTAKSGGLSRLVSVTAIQNGAVAASRPPGRTV